QMLRLLAMTAAIWTTEALIVSGLALSFGIEISIRSAALVSAVLALGLMVPAGPGGLGTYELAGVAGLKVVGVDPSSALALTLVIHAWAFITNVGLGLCLLACGCDRPGSAMTSRRLESTGPPVPRRRRGGVRRSRAWRAPRWPQAPARVIRCGCC